MPDYLLGGSKRPPVRLFYVSIYSVLCQYCLDPEFELLGYNIREVIWMDLKFTMVMDKEIAQKMSYIGKYYGRSRIKEIEWAAKEWVARFEAEHGPITREDMDKLTKKAGD